MVKTIVSQFIFTPGTELIETVKCYDMGLIRYVMRYYNKVHSVIMDVNYNSALEVNSVEFKEI